MSLPPLYWLGTSRWCSDPCVLAPLSFVFVFFYCHVVFVAGLVLFLHVFPAMFVISFGLAFLSFMQFLLLTLYIVPCFFLSRFFISIFIPILLYKRIWAFVGQIVFDGSKGYQTQFALVCQSHFVEELYFAIDLYSAANLYSTADFFLSPGVSIGFYYLSIFFGPFLLFGLLGGHLCLAFYWAFFLIGFSALLFVRHSSSWTFGYGFAKTSINTNH